MVTEQNVVTYKDHSKIVMLLSEGVSLSVTQCDAGGEKSII